MRIRVRIHTFPRLSPEPVDARLIAAEEACVFPVAGRSPGTSSQSGLHRFRNG